MIYKLELSNKEVIQISEKEFELFKENIGGGFIEFSNGIVNPSFVVCCVVDLDASREESKRIARETTYEEVSAPKEQGTLAMKDILDKVRPTYLLGEAQED